jgi:DNA polymerase elongation subunit (family B)
MKFNVQELNKHVAGSDTDSLIISLENILKHRINNYETEGDETVIEQVKKLQQEIGEKLNTYQTTIASKCFNSPEHYLDLKPEYIIKKTYWAGKRRYAQYIIDKEGIPVEELDIKGLDIMKSNFPPYFKNFGEELIKSILFGKKKEDVDRFVMDFKNSMHTIEWIKLLKPTGLKKLGEYIDRKPMAGELFSKLKLKCPINTKAAIIYNDFIHYKNLHKKYPEFTIGDKMYIAYLKPNPYKIEVIGYNGYNDPPEITQLIDKYIDRDGLFDSIIRNKLETVYADIGWELSLNPYKSLFFSFN